MGLRGVKNALGAGTQQVTAEEAAAQTNTNPVANQMLQTATGAGPDSVKMTGTPAQQQGALSRVSQTLTARDAKVQTQTAAQQGATVNAAAAQQSVALQTLAKTAPMVAERIKNSILAQSAPASLTDKIDRDALKAKLGASAPEAEALLRKQIGGTPLSPQETARLTALVKPAGGALTQADLGAFVKDPAQGMDAAKQIFGNKDPKAMSLGQLTEEDAKKLGFQNLADLELSTRSITGKSLAETNIAELESAAASYAAKNATDVGKLRATISDATASGAEKAFAQEKLRQLGYENVLTEQARQGDLAKQIAAGDTVRVGGVSMPVGDITKSPEILAMLAPALVEGTAGELALADLEAKSPELAAFARKNRAALAPVLASFQGPIEALAKAQEAKLEAFGGKALLADPVFSNLLKNAGIDPNKMDGAVVDPASIPEPMRSIIAVSKSANEPGLPLSERNARAQSAIRQAALSEKLSSSGLTRFAKDPKTLATLASLPAGSEDDFIKLESTTDALADAAVTGGPGAKELQARTITQTRIVPGKPPFGKPTQVRETVPNPAWETANKQLQDMRKNNLAPAVGVGAKEFAATLASLTNPALQGTFRTSVLTGELAGDPAFKSGAAFEAATKALAATAGNNSLPIADRIAAQKKLGQYGEALKALNPTSETAKTAVKTVAAAADKKAVTELATAPKLWVDVSRDMAGHREAADAMYNDTKNPNPRKLEIHADNVEALVTKSRAALNAAKTKYAASPSAQAELKKQEAELVKAEAEAVNIRKLAGWLRNNR
jgi:hypothetical protein